MRKRTMKKKRSCPLCKPHKVGWDKRYKNKDFDKLEIAEKVIEELKKEVKYDARSLDDCYSNGGNDY